MCSGSWLAGRLLLCLLVVKMKSRSRRCEDVVKVSTLGKVRRSRDLPVAAARKNNYIKIKVEVKETKGLREIQSYSMAGHSKEDHIIIPIPPARS